MKLVPLAFLAFSLAAGAGIVACSSSNDDSPGAPPATTSDDAAPPATDGAGPSDAGTIFPAAHPPLPEVLNLGGPVLDHPKLVPIFFPGFQFRTEMLDFAKKLGPTAYWHAIGTEYGVGQTSVEAPIDIADAPAALIHDQDIKAWLQSMFDGTHPEFGSTPIDGAIYTLFYPPTTTISLATSTTPTPDAGADGGDAGRPRNGGQTSCRGFGGYHEDVRIGGKLVSYAVIPQCAKFGPLTGADVVTGTSSHEWIEAATDPLPTSQPAYSTVDEEHLIWTYALGAGEVGDMCAQYDDSFYKPAELGYTVQRSWSNAAAKAGSQPCVPAISTNPYFNAAPLFKDDVTMTLGTTKGITVPVGGKKTFELDLFSSAPTSGPWTVKVGLLSGGPPTDAGSSGSTPAAVEFALDKNTGVNGDKINVTVKANAAASARLGGTPFIIESTLGNDVTYWAGIVGN